MAQHEQYIIHFTDPYKSSFIISPYTSNGNVSPIASSGSLDSSAISANTSLLLYGKGMSNYGERIQENILHILENFSSTTTPILPVSGQLWFQRKEYWKNGSNWYRWNDSTNVWDSITLEYSQSGDPGSVPNGEHWFNTGTSILKRRVNESNHPLHNTWVTTIYGTYSGAPGTGSPINDTPPEKALKVYDGQNWDAVSSTVFASQMAPDSPSLGDLWFDTNPVDDPWNSNQLKVWDGTNWISSGGNYVLRTGDSMSGDLTMVDANININTGQGLVGNISGSPLGDGSTLKLSSAGLGWEVQAGGGGSPVVDPVFIVKDSGGTAILTINVNNIDANNNKIINLSDPTDDQDAATKLYVDTIAGLQDELSELSDVDLETSVVDKDILIYDTAGSPSGRWRNRQFEVTDINGVSTATGVEVEYLAGVTSSIQGQINAKASLDSPSFVNTPTAPTQTVGDNSTKLATTAFIQNAISGGGASDGVLVSGSWNASIYQLSLNTTAGSPSTITVDLPHNHTSVEVNHFIQTPLLRDQLSTDLNYPDVDLATIVRTLSTDVAQKIKYSDYFILREVFRPTSGQSNFTLVNSEYVVGFNHLQIFINGVKQLNDERAMQVIYFETNKNISPTAPTGLPNNGTPYSFTVAVDGQATGSPQSPQTVNVTGSQVQTVQDIIDQINTQVSGATATFNRRDIALFIFSDISGNGSAIDVTDVDFFAALEAVAGGSPGNIGLPIYTAGNIFPTFPSAITQVTNNGAYYEALSTGSPSVYNQVAAGTSAIDIVFRTAVPAGSVVEILISP